MYKIGYITFIDKKNSNLYVNLSNQGCSRGCTGCSAGNSGCDIDIYGPIKFNTQFNNLELNDKIEFEIYPKIHLIPGLYLFLFPIIAMLIIYYISTKFNLTNLNIWIISISSLFIYILIARILNKIWKTKEKGKVLRIL